VADQRYVRKRRDLVDVRRAHFSIFPPVIEPGYFAIGETLRAKIGLELVLSSLPEGVVMRRIWLSVLALLAVILLAVTFVPFFFQWSPLNCWHEDVDITTGRIRRQWILLFVKVNESIEETPLSEVVLRGQPPPRTPQWQRVNTFSPGIHYSPHYRYHGAGHQIRTLAELWNLPAPHDFPPELKESTARHVLALWQEGSDHRAGDYIMQLYEVMDDENRSGIIEAVGRIKMPEFETVGKVTRKAFFYPNGRLMERFEGYLNASGEFTADGVWESWHADGKRAVYGHFREGQHDGRRFEWDRDGKLMAIKGFGNNELTEYEGSNLASHPDFETANELARSSGNN
jgi:hypothetical protein